MRWMLYLATAAVLALGMTRPGAADEPKVDLKAKQFKVQGKFSEILPDDKAETSTRIPAYYTLEGRKSTYHSGGLGIHGNAVIGSEPAPYGFSLQLTIARAGGDDLVLDFALENSQLSGDAKSAHTAALSTVRKAKVGKSLRIILEEDAKGVPRQWLDLTVSEADE